jgi:glycerol-3-phosphate dehydrogenase
VTSAWRLDPQARREAWRRLTRDRFDVLVVGDGITGSGVALDAASRGLATALVEARDLASGTSSRSSKLIHGGLRYLEQFDFAQVREALRERERDDATLLEPLHGADEYLRAEVRYGATHEGALHLDDLLTRRTRVSIEFPLRGVDSAPATAGLTPLHSGIPFMIVRTTGTMSHPAGIGPGRRPAGGDVSCSFGDHG